MIRSGSGIGLAMLVACLTACPQRPMKIKPRPRTRVAPPAYPYRGWQARVQTRVHIFDQSKRRALAVRLQTVKGGILKPVGLVGIDKVRGRVEWTRDLPLRFLDPLLPWSIEVARNSTYVAAWVEGGQLVAFDIYGRDAWKTTEKGFLGVAALGEGFVTAKGSQIFYLQRKEGKPTKVADVGAPITHPLAILKGGIIVALTGDFVVGVDIDLVQHNKVIFRRRLKLPEGLRPVKPQTLADRVVVGSQAIPRVIKTEVTLLDPATLQPRWRKLLPGRVRSHHALSVLGDEIRLIARQQGEPDRMYRLSGKDGTITGRITAKPRRGCQYGAQLYCITKTAMTAYDRTTLNKAWTRQLFDDVTGNEHLPHGSRIYIAEGSKVAGVDQSGRLAFSFSPTAPGMRLQVNRVLGIAGGTMVITVVDWLKKKGEVWGVDIATSKKKWGFALPAPGYTEKSVQLIGDRVVWADHTFLRSADPKTGQIRSYMAHWLRAPVTKIPSIGKAGTTAWMIRDGTLARFDPQSCKVEWKHLLAGEKIVHKTPNLLFLKSATGTISAFDMQTHKVRWTQAHSPALPTPKIIAVAGGVMMSYVAEGGGRAWAMDPQTGKQKWEWKPGGWHLAKVAGAPLIVRVVTFVPKEAGVVESFRYDRKTKEMSGAWVYALPKPAKPEPHLASCVRGDFPWFHAAGDMVTLPSRGGRCLIALDIEEGKPRWKNCDLAWPSPPRHFRSHLYTATGRHLDSYKEEHQGLFAVSDVDGKAKQIAKVPRTGDRRFMWAQFGAVVRGEFYVLTQGRQGNRLRQVFVASPK